jgi:hypothetical protein
MSRLTLAVVLAIATMSAVLSTRKAPARYTPFVPQTPPQRALGDFDGDGRVDTVSIQDRHGDRRISVQLSGSASAIDLEAVVSAVVEDDVDHDGDLDLVAATADGNVLVWLNDGHGRFTRQASSTRRGMSGGPSVADATWPEWIAINLRAPLLSPTRTEPAVVVMRARPPNADWLAESRSSRLPAVRAPPSGLS